MASKPFKITFKNFNDGAAPLAHLDPLTSLGSGGHYSAAGNVDIISAPPYLTQGPGLSTLTDGTQAGAVTDLINFILDKPTSADVTYGVSATRLHRITPTSVINTGAFPRTITGATDGESCIELLGSLYYFFNKASGADIGKYDLASTFDDDWGSTVPTGAAALQSAPHPVAKKQDIMLFGNGRYVGTYVAGTNTLAPTKLDFGSSSECADVAFHANQWWIAVNSGVTSGTNRASGQVYLYDGAAIYAQLADEVALGVQQIGFIYPINGIVYIAYRDLSTTGGFAIGYISGRQIKRLRSFTGSLPTYAQKTLYKNTIAFVSNGLIYSVGAVIEQLPIQISQLADGGFTTVGALAAPFGTPMVASTQSSSYKLAQFSGYDTACAWRSVIVPVTEGRKLGMIDRIIVLTNVLGSGASCALKTEHNQAVAASSALTITTTGKTRHVFSPKSSPIEDFRLFLDWSGGSASNPVTIRQIEVEGHFVEK